MQHNGHIFCSTVFLSFPGVAAVARHFRCQCGAYWEAVAASEEPQHEFRFTGWTFEPGSGAFEFNYRCTGCGTYRAISGIAPARLPNIGDLLAMDAPGNQ